MTDKGFGQKDPEIDSGLIARKYLLSAGRKMIMEV